MLHGKLTTKEDFVDGVNGFIRKGAECSEVFNQSPIITKIDGFLAIFNKEVEKLVGSLSQARRDIENMEIPELIYNCTPLYLFEASLTRIFEHCLETQPRLGLELGAVSGFLIHVRKLKAMFELESIERMTLEHNPGYVEIEHRMHLVAMKKGEYHRNERVKDIKSQTKKLCDYIRDDVVNVLMLKEKENNLVAKYQDAILFYHAPNNLEQVIEFMNHRKLHKELERKKKAPDPYRIYRAPETTAEPTRLYHARRGVRYTPRAPRFVPAFHSTPLRIQPLKTSLVVQKKVEDVVVRVEEPRDEGVVSEEDELPSYSPLLTRPFPAALEALNTFSSEDVEDAPEEPAPDAPNAPEEPAAAPEPSEAPPAQNAPKEPSEGSESDLDGRQNDIFNQLSSPEDEEMLWRHAPRAESSESDQPPMPGFEGNDELFYAPSEGSVQSAPRARDSPDAPGALETLGDPEDVDGRRESSSDDSERTYYVISTPEDIGSPLGADSEDAPRAPEAPEDVSLFDTAPGASGASGASRAPEDVGSSSEPAPRALDAPRAPEAPENVSLFDPAPNRALSEPAPRTPLAPEDISLFEPAPGAQLAPETTLGAPESSEDVAQYPAPMAPEAMSAGDAPGALGAPENAQGASESFSSPGASHFAPEASYYDPRASYHAPEAAPIAPNAPECSAPCAPAPEAVYNAPTAPRAVSPFTEPAPVAPGAAPMAPRAPEPVHSASDAPEFSAPAPVARNAPEASYYAPEFSAPAPEAVYDAPELNAPCAPAPNAPGPESPFSEPAPVAPEAPEPIHSAPIAPNVPESSAPCAPAPGASYYAPEAVYDAPRAPEPIFSAPVAPNAPEFNAPCAPAPGPVSPYAEPAPLAPGAPGATYPFAPAPCAPEPMSPFAEPAPSAPESSALAPEVIQNAPESPESPHPTSSENSAENSAPKRSRSEARSSPEIAPKRNRTSSEEHNS